MALLLVNETNFLVALSFLLLKLGLLGGFETLVKHLNCHVKVVLLFVLLCYNLIYADEILRDESFKLIIRGIDSPITGSL